MKTIRIADLESVRASRPNGYVEDVLCKGKIAGEVLLIENEVYFALKNKYKTVSWPIWVKLLAKRAIPEDKGIGDVAVRLIGPENSESFRKYYKMITGKSCGCKGRQAKWNRLYPFVENKV